jgi:dihydrofolate synthase/folylpolyglutamate synthase
MKTYGEAVRFLDHFINYEKNQEQLVYSEKNLDLEDFKRFLGQWNLPQNRMNFIHIAGTKGKGSTAAMLEAALIDAGFHVGLYTSPHLESYLERFRIDGRQITEECFLTYLEELKGHLREIPSSSSSRFRTVFELLTAMAFLLFRDEKVDMAIMETGLGGRLDATNIIQPRLCVITALGLDHTHLLGNKITDIAKEKGGIIKNGIPLILSQQEKSTRELTIPVLRRICNTVNAPFIEAVKQVEILENRLLHNGRESGAISGQKIRFRMEMEEHEVIMPLLGNHQVENCRTAITALTELNKRGLPVDLPKAFQGFSRTHWPGRFEILPGSPLTVLDGAHCPLSARALVRTLNDCFPGYNRVYLLGILKGKDVAGISRELSQDPLCHHMISFPSPSPRGYKADELASIIKGVYQGVEIADSPEKAVDIGIEYTKKGGVVVVTGSLYHLEMMKKALLKNRQ